MFIGIEAEWVKIAQVAVLVVVAGFYTYAFLQTFWGLIEGRAKSRIAGQLAFGRCLRHLAVLSFIAGALHSTLVNLSRPFTFRSFVWIAGSWFAFLAWTILDRRRWEMEE